MSTDPQPVDVTKSPGEFEQITLRVGPGGHRAQRFFGRQITETREAGTSGITVTRVYRSRKGKYVIHKRRSNWLDLADVRSWGTDWKSWVSQSVDPLGDGPGTGDYTVDIVDTLEELRAHVPARACAEVTDVATHPLAQDLDV
ncbi:EXLDI protein [Nocardia sp. NPDC127579]|uniref:EXLDI protein n=1 Tax=Nocardia sp. NPDC127579 TaxID=3345402 RepID=UPI003636C2E4